MLTHEDTALLEGAGALLKEARRQIAELSKEVGAIRTDNNALRACLRKAKQELLIAQTDAAHYQEAALAWKEEARILRLANASFPTPPLRAGPGESKD